MAINKVNYGNNVIFQGLLFDSRTNKLSIFPNGNSVDLSPLTGATSSSLEFTDFTLDNNFLTVTLAGSDGVPQVKSVYLPYADLTQFTGVAPVEVDVLTGQISMLAADADSDGYITAVDWSRFNEKAELDSPVFTGVPEAPTPSVDDNSTKIATTEYVDRAIGLVEIPEGGGIPFEYGSISFDGDGVTTQFIIPHGITGVPDYFSVVAASFDAAYFSHVTADATNIYVNYTLAPQGGGSNVVLNWMAIPSA